MNILLIGNGFDLAHGLPTKYTDFLEFVKIIKKIKEVKEIRPFTRYEEIADKYNLHPCIKTSIYACFQEKLSKESKELLELVDKNFWLEYFLKNPMYQRENWIDFESEIGKVIRSTECDMRGKNFDGRIGDLTIKCLSDFYLYKEIREKRVDHITYRALRDALLKDLNRLIRIFEIYLCNYVENIPCNGILPDIQDARFDKILSFNYTDIYRKRYDKNKKAEYDFIHGKADEVHSFSANGLVLGIDEYLPEERKNIDLEFIAFKKFYQRIYKGTGCNYKVWLNEIESDKWNDHLKSDMHNLYIFGHSLDVTDKDILRDLILHNNVYTTVFYFNKDNLGAKIVNLVKVIGQDELIRRTGGYTKTIEFKLQKNMIRI